MNQEKNLIKGKSAFSLLPLFSFLILYMGAGLFFTLKGQEMAFYQFPAASAALLAFVVALVLSPKNITQSIDDFIEGISDKTVILMCLVFLLAGAFSSITKAVGSIDSAVNLGRFLMPDQFLVPGIFLIACFVSFAMGTSMGTIATIGPIAVGISEASGINIGLVIATVIGGSMFGDNLSVISDTTIAATGTQGCSMKDKMKANAKISLIAALIVFVLLFILSPTVRPQTEPVFSLWSLLPYLLVLILAIKGFHVILVLMIGIISALLVGLLSFSIEPAQVGKLIYEGFLSMNDVFFVTFLIAGLTSIATKKGGLEVLLNKIKFLAKGKKSAEAVMAVGISIADICVANNTIAILFFGPLAKKLAKQFNISKARTASILDIFSCVWQGIIPHGAQILLASGLAKISVFAILPYSFYPAALAITASLTIFMKGEKSA